MTDQGFEDRLAALKRSGRTTGAPSASAEGQDPPATPASRRARSTRSSGTKWTLAGGAVGATLTLIGVMSGPLASESNTPSSPAAQPVVIVINQSDTMSTAIGDGPVNVDAVVELLPALPAAVEADRAAQPISESGGS